MTKTCSICTSEFKAKDNTEYCTDCDMANYPKHASYWKNYFTNNPLDVNKLTPKNEKLLNALQATGHDFLVDRLALQETRSFSSGLVRNLSDIEADSKAKNAYTLDDVKAQVKDLLPGALESLGIRNANIELIANLLVPARINMPIHTDNPSQLVQTAIMDVASFLHIDTNTLSGGLKPHGTIKKLANGAQFMDEGIQRLQPDMGTHIRTLDDVRENEEHEGEIPMDELDAIPVDDAPPMEGGPEMGLEGVPQPAPYEEEMGMAGEPVLDETISGEPGVSEVPMDGDGPMYEGINRHGPMPGEEEFIEEEPPQFVPEGGLRRVEQSLAPRVRPIPRTAKKVNVKQVRPEMFTFAGRIAAHLPVQSVQLSDKEINVINAHQALNFVTAKFNDGFQKTYSYYKTDKGYLFVEPNEKFAFHANTESDFLKFIQTDSSFTRWAFLPKNYLDPMHVAESPWDDHDEEQNHDDDDYAESISDIKTRNREMGNYGSEVSDDTINRIAKCYDYFDTLLPHVTAEAKTDLAIVAFEKIAGPMLGKEVSQSPLPPAEDKVDKTHRWQDEQADFDLHGKPYSADNPAWNEHLDRLNRDVITEPQKMQVEHDYPGMKLPGGSQPAIELTQYSPLKKNKSGDPDKGPFVHSKPKTDVLVSNEPYVETNSDLTRLDKAEAPATSRGGDNPEPAGKLDVGVRPEKFNTNRTGPQTEGLPPGKYPAQMYRKQAPGKPYEYVEKEPAQSTNWPASRTPGFSARQEVDVPAEKADKQRRLDMLNKLTRGKNPEYSTKLPGMQDRVAMESALNELVKIATSQYEIDCGLEYLIVEAGFDPEALLEVFAAQHTDKEIRQEKHIEDSEKKAGKSAKEAESIGWATVNKQKKSAGFEVKEVPKPDPQGHANDMDERKAPMNAIPKGIYEKQMDKKEKKLVQASEDEYGPNEEVTKIAPKDEASEDAKRGLHNHDKTEHGIQDSDDDSGNAYEYAE